MHSPLHKTAAEVKDLLRTRNMLSPIVIIDEFPALDKFDSTLTKLKLMRNFCRVLDCGLLVMGSNAAAANFLSQELSRTGKAHEWCYVFPRLPPVSLDRLTLPRSLNDNVFRVIIKSRPLFAHIALDHIGVLGAIGAKSIDEWLKAIWEGIVEQKNLFLPKHYPF